MMWIIGLFCLTFFSSAHALFDMSMYRAHKAYQAGEFTLAKKKYEQKLLCNPDDVQLNFNMGDVLYRTQQFDKAHDYFMRVACITRAGSPLKEQAYFNAGNASVKLKELQRAIEQYEKVLEINSENERAKHNLEIVKKMLEQQQQQEQNKKEDQQKNQDKQKDQQGQGQQDQQQSEQGSSRGEQEKDADNKEQSGNDLDRKKGEKKREGQGKDQQAKKQDQDSDGKSGSGSDEPSKTEQNGQETNDRKPHTTSTTPSDDTTTQAESNPTPGDSKEQDKQRHEELLRMLDQKDKEQNKRLMMMQVNKGMTKQDGQKNW